MFKNKFFAVAAAGFLIASFGMACSKKHTDGTGVNTEANSNLKRIHFDFDKYSIRTDAVPAMKDNAKWLQENQNVNVVVEGHCDERGTNEYNMALGERRANAAKNYLVNLGVATGRVSTVSFGEEKPASSGHDEGAWSENRRAEFVTRK